MAEDAAAEGVEIARPVSRSLLNNDEFERSWRMAKGLAESGMFKDARSAAQAWAKIMLGRDLGLSPTQAMTGLHIVEGRPQVAAVTLGAFVKRTPGYDYRIVSLTNEECTIEFTQDGEKLGTSQFTMEDAQRANLVKPNSGWTKFPRNMLFARALSNGVRWFCPDVTHGISVYTEGEIESSAVSLTTAGDVAAEWGDDPEVKDGLQAVFSALGYTPVKVRMVLRGCKSQEDRETLLGRLRDEFNARHEPEPPDAEVVEEAA